MENPDIVALADIITNVLYLMVIFVSGIIVGYLFGFVDGNNNF